MIQIESYRSNHTSGSRCLRQPGVGRYEIRFPTFHAEASLCFPGMLRGVCRFDVFCSQPANGVRLAKQLECGGYRWQHLGPFTGAIARHFQSCCWRFSPGLFPYCAALLLGGFGFQFVPIPRRSVEGPIRLVAWMAGLLGWFGGCGFFWTRIVMTSRANLPFRAGSLTER